MLKTTEDKINLDIRNNIGWFYKGEEITLPEGVISTIMAIIRVNLEAEKENKQV